MVRWPADKSGDGSNRPLVARPSSLPTRRQVEREAVVAACLSIETWEAGVGRAGPERHDKMWVTCRYFRTHSTSGWLDGLAGVRDPQGS
jgi:hypothetical protein